MIVSVSLRSNRTVLASHAQEIGRRGRRFFILAAGAVLLHIQGAFAQTMGTESAAVHAAYQAGFINSLEAADAALAEAGRARSEIEARFAAEEQACHARFFTTSCIDSAQERRRQALEPLRGIELDAEQFKRRDRLMAREDAAEERRAKEAADRLERMRPLRERDRAAGPGQPEAVRTELVAGLPGRAAEHEARQRRRTELDAANAKKRAENVAKYEKKAHAAKERQKKIAQKKAAKENDRHAAQHASPAAAQ